MLTIRKKKRHDETSEMPMVIVLLDVGSVMQGR